MLSMKDLDFAIEIILFLNSEVRVILEDAREITYLPGELVGHGDLIDVEPVAEETRKVA